MEINYFIDQIKSLKSKYSSSYFEKKGLYAVLNDIANNIDKRIISVLKKADELTLPEKLKKLRDEDDSNQAILVSNLKQDFVDNTGLEPKMAALVFDVYLFGLDLKQDLNPLEYKATKVANGIHISELIELAIADKRLEKNEMINIFSKGISFGLKENEIFESLVKCIKDFNLKPLPYSDAIQPKNKEILLKYDWVEESIIKREYQKTNDIDFDREREQRRVLAVQKDQGLVSQKDKELEIKRIELELKKKEQEAKEQEEQKKLELEKIKARELKKQKRNQSFRTFFNWLVRKDSKGDSPLVWALVLISIGVLVFWALNRSEERDEREDEAQVLSIQLEKKYEKINNYLQDGLIDSAKILIPDLVHPSTERSPYKSDEEIEHYNYNEYWQLKREKLRIKIQEIQDAK